MSFFESVIPARATTAMVRSVFESIVDMTICTVGCMTENREDRNWKDRENLYLILNIIFCHPFN